MYSDSASESGSNSVIVNPAGLMCTRRPSIVRCRVVTREGVAESRLRAGSASARWKEAVLYVRTVPFCTVPRSSASVVYRRRSTGLDRHKDKAIIGVTD